MATATAVEPVTEARFRAMGTDVHVLLVRGSSALLERSRHRVEELEARWSRFQPDSELSRLNRNAGRPLVISPISFELVSRAVESWFATSGRFDPTVLGALAAAGYDRSFERVCPSARTPAESAEPPPGCADIVLDPIVRAVTLPRGVTLDLGGIGKGFAADVVSSELITDGAAGACVNLGGDLRVRGTPPDGSWIVEIEVEPGTVKRGAPRWLGLTEGAVATTSSRRRVWQRAGTRMHHVIDPRTGSPVESPPTSATVVAADAWRAEVLAKAVFIARSPHEAENLLRSARATGVLVDGAGRTRPLHGIERFLA